MPRRPQVLQPLGRGGMGVVHTAFDEILGRVVAINTIRTARSAAVAHTRILREARALARLSHPNLVQIYDVGRGARRDSPRYGTSRARPCGRGSRARPGPAP